MGSLSLTGQGRRCASRSCRCCRAPHHIDATIDALEAAMDDTVAALFVEPIQGEAGVVELPEGFLQRARELTTQHGALLIIDEIQTGAGRTGSWFDFQQHGIVPDAIAVAKGIAGGVPDRRAHHVRRGIRPVPARAARQHVRRQPARDDRRERGARRDRARRVSSMPRPSRDRASGWGSPARTRRWSPRSAAPGC